MRTVDDHDEMVALCGGDTLCLWAAQGPGGGSRAWVSDDGRGFAVAGAGISLRDRLAVRGPAEAVVPLVRDVLPEVGPTFRPLGDRSVVEAVIDGVPGLVVGKSFGWMHSTATAGSTRTGRPRTSAARWLADAELGEATALLEAVFPTSNAKPGVPGVECWAGIRDDDGRLTALAALAWSAPDVGLITGVAVHPDVQGKGLGREVCDFILSAALTRHGNAGLMVDAWNQAAIRLYQRLGMAYRPVLAAYVDR